jgi:hypothetical protein
MKKIVLILSAVALIAVAGCKKGEVISDVNALQKGSYVTLVKNVNLELDFTNINNSIVSQVVQQYGEPVEKVKVFVTKGNTTLDNTKWKAIKEVAINGETTIAVKASEIATALGVPLSSITPGSSYTLYNQVISKDGRKFDLTNTGSTFATNSNYKMALSWKAVVVCPFVAPVGGMYEVIEDTWEDWPKGSTVTVVDGPAGSNTVDLRNVWPSPSFGTPISPFFILTVKPENGAVTIPATKWGDYAASGYIAETLANGTNGYVFSCTGEITLNVRIKAGSFGDQGVKQLILKKK